jgi:hypothetical protein
MAKPDTLIVDGHAYSWQRLCELRRQQLEAWRLSQPEQPALFPLNADLSSPVPTVNRRVGGAALGWAAPYDTSRGVSCWRLLWPAA